MRRRLIMLCGLVALVMLGSGIAKAGGGPSVDWNVMGSGGGHGVSGVVAVDVTIGQAVVGVTSIPGYTVCVGFWCGLVPNWRVIMPLIQR